MVIQCCHHLSQAVEVIIICKNEDDSINGGKRSYRQLNRIGGLRTDQAGSGARSRAYSRAEGGVTPSEVPRPPSTRSNKPTLSKYPKKAKPILILNKDILNIFFQSYLGLF